MSDDKILMGEVMMSFFEGIREAAKKENEHPVVFVTSDLMEAFTKDLPRSTHVNVEAISIGSPIENVEFKAGYSGMINNIFFHIIEGKQKFFVGRNMDFAYYFKKLKSEVDKKNET